MQDGRSQNALGLPAARVKIIMKSSPDIDHLSPQAIYVMTKATEFFVQQLARTAKGMSDPNKLDYKDLSDAVQEHSEFEFLNDVIPPKMTVAEWRKLKAKGKKDYLVESSSEEDSSDEKSDDSDDQDDDDSN